MCVLRRHRAKPNDESLLCGRLTARSERPDAGALADTTVAVTLAISGRLRPPPPAVHFNTGIYILNLDTTPASGEWLLSVAGTGAVRATAEAVFEVTSAVVR